MATEQDSTSWGNTGLALYTDRLPGYLQEVIRMADASRLRSRAELVVHDDGVRRIVLRLQGTEKTLRESGLFPRGFAFPLRRSRRLWYPPISGDMIAGVGDLFEFRTDESELPIRCVTLPNSDVERCEYADNAQHKVQYCLWGFSREIEILAGLSKGKLKRKSRSTSSGGQADHAWSVTFFPNGKVHYRVWSTTAGARDVRQDPTHAILDALDSGLERGLVSTTMPFYDEHIGTQREIIEAGICTAAQFPVAPKRRADFPNSNPDLFSNVIRAVRCGRFSVIIYKKVDYSKHSVDPEPAEYASLDAYAAYAEKMMLIGMSAIEDVLNGETETRRRGHATMKYDKDTLATVKRCCAELWQAFQSGTPALTKRAAAQAKGLVSAKGDDAFQAFMGHLLVGTGGESH